MAVTFIDPNPQYTTVDLGIAARSQFEFFDSATSNPKAIFADDEKQTPLSNPVLTNIRGELPVIYFDGTARVVRKDDINGVLKERWDIDFVSGAGAASTFQQWNASVTYSISEIVQASDGNLYQSAINGNLNNDPISSPTAWVQIATLNWSPVITYPINANAVGSDGVLYKSLINGNLNNDPTVSPSEWSTLDVSLDPLGAYSETLVAVPVLDIDLATGNVFTKTLTANSTLTFSNALTNSSSFTLQIAGGDTWVVTWPASVTKWLDGAEPVLGAIHEIVFTTLDGGINFTGYSVGEVAAP